MSATDTRAVSAGDVLRNHMEGQAAAEQFLQSLRRYSMTGTELERVHSAVQFMEQKRPFHGITASMRASKNAVSAPWTFHHEQSARHQNANHCPSLAPS